VKHVKGAGYFEHHTHGTTGSFSGYIRILRVDHWVKNVFVFPGVIVAVSMQPEAIGPDLLAPICLGLLSICLIASSNYVINEIQDGPFDRLHPVKCRRPVPSGQVHISFAYAEWLIFMALGVGAALAVSTSFLVTMAVLWIMGLIYNIPPVRSKDVPYLDVASEALNNPLRFLAGWFLVLPHAVPPASLLVSYWMIGCYFMATKRFAEYRDFHNPHLAGEYRRTFKFYDERRLLVSIMFYSAASMLFFGAFIVRYRLELILTFPIVAIVMAVYLAIAFKKESAAQAPEKLYKEPALMLSIIGCVVLMVALLFVDIPALKEMFPAMLRTWGN
jgi:4-hydroxybenzoate polyprenyltransferase